MLEELNCVDNMAGADVGSKWTWFEFEIYALKLTSSTGFNYPHKAILPSATTPH